MYNSNIHSSGEAVLWLSGTAFAYDQQKYIKGSCGLVVLPSHMISTGRTISLVIISQVRAKTSFISVHKSMHCAIVLEVYRDISAPAIARTLLTPCAKDLKEGNLNEATPSGKTKDKRCNIFELHEDEKKSIFPMKCF